MSDIPEVGFDDGDDPASTQGDITFRYHDKVEREHKRRGKQVRAWIMFP